MYPSPIAGRFPKTEKKRRDGPHNPHPPRRRTNRPGGSTGTCLLRAPISSGVASSRKQLLEAVPDTTCCSIASQARQTRPTQSLPSTVEIRLLDHGDDVRPTFRNQKDIMPENARLTTSDVPLMKLGPYQCRFPVREDRSVPGGHRFCAGPTSPDRVYCDHHHSIVTVVEPRRARSGFHLAPRRAA